MSRLTDLIAKAKAKDSALGAELDREFKILSSRLPFGLNFERHSPEAVELPLRPISKGDKVCVQPERGTTRKGDQRLSEPQRMKQDNISEPFFITEEVEAEMIAAGYKFEPPFIACTLRLRDVLEGISDAELALQPGEIADQERERRQSCVS
ncbi:hypothetical protein [Alcaligenes endophyticus]|uniref:hypothetical protein n=1 Tax=Alcaligenes endophyticus TaxID=1929088 RepID=UPI003F4A3560